jgi:hypothetical protein
MFNESNENNILILADVATPEDLHRVVAKFTDVTQYDTYEYGGEFTVDPAVLSEEQRSEIRAEFGHHALFSDGSGEPGDIILYFTGEVQLLDSGELIVSGYSFITEDKNKEYADAVDNFAYGIPHPTHDQVRDMFLPLLIKV